MKRKPTPIQTLDMTASRWKFLTGPEFNYSNVNMPPCPTQEMADSWRYHFPLAPGKVAYLLCPHTARITAAGITGEFEFVGDGVIQDAKAPWGEICTARFILYRDLTTARGRWWSKPHLLLEAMRNNGPHALTVSFQPQDWTGVNGEEAADYIADFNACKEAPTHLGITHGAADAGHGLNLASGALLAVARGIRLV